VSLILDASATLASVYTDEATPAIVALFDKITEESAWVPTLWRFEIVNGLSSGVRRGRLKIARRDSALADLDSLPIFEDAETGVHLWSDTLALSDKYKLTIYDASYLELALRFALPLATLDQQLRHAAATEGVILLGI
jgi:predicted nucleic acid-binding protein